MSYQTLKFYCNEGLIPNVQRDKNNYRIFDENNINWIKSLACLKKCGMSIDEMKKYLNLCLQGESTIPQRQAMLAEKKKDLELKKNEIEDSMAFINWKQNFYDEVLSGKTEYFSYLIDINKLSIKYKIFYRESFIILKRTNSYLYLSTLFFTAL